MKKSWILSACIGVCLAGLLTAQVSSGVPAPRATVEQLLDSVKALSRSPEAKPDPAMIKRISEVMDVQGVSKTCLGPQWNRLSPQEQKSFVRLFQDVLEKVAYPKSAKFFKDTGVRIEDASVQSAAAQVPTVVTHPKEGEVEVDYKLQMVDGKWLVEDVILDGVSLVQDLRAQMQKIIKEKSYQALKRKLTEKLNEETSS